MIGLCVFEKAYSNKVERENTTLITCLLLPPTKKGFAPLTTSTSSITRAIRWMRCRADLTTCTHVSLVNAIDIGTCLFTFKSWPCASIWKYSISMRFGISWITSTIAMTGTAATLAWDRRVVNCESEACSGNALNHAVVWEWSLQRTDWPASVSIANADMPIALVNQLALAALGFSLVLQTARACRVAALTIQGNRPQRRAQQWGLCADT